MDIYRITRVGPRRTWKKQEVRYGTKRQASAIARQVREDNEARKRTSECYPSIPYLPVQVTIELAHVENWADVTGEFI